MPARLSKRKDGRYQINAMVNQDGELIRKYFYGKTQAEAKAKLKKFLDEGGAPRRKNETTLDEWIDKWMSAYASGGYRNKENNRSILRRFSESIGKRYLKDIKPIDIQEYAKTQAGFTKSHVDKVRRVLNKLFETAVSNNLIDKNPCKDAEWHNEKTGTHEVISAEIIKLITDFWKIHPAGVWAMLMLYAGLRPSEAFALRRENVRDGFIIVEDGSHFEHGRLVVARGTTKSEAGSREIPILPQLSQVFSSLPEREYICVTTKGEPVSEAAARSNWAALWNMLEELYNGRIPHKAGRRSDLFPDDWKYIPKIRMYDLRHTYCSMLYDADVDVKTAQYLMGHATLDITLKIYTHLSEAKKKRSYDKLFEYFGVRDDVKKPETH